MNKIIYVERVRTFLWNVDGRWFQQTRLTAYNRVLAARVLLTEFNTGSTKPCILHTISPPHP